MANNSARVHHFPQEIVTKILLGVPVKDLLRFKTVCKPWLSIISNPGFIKSYLHRAIISAPTPTLLTILNPPPLEDELAVASNIRHFLSVFETATPPALLRRQQFVDKALDDVNGQDLSNCQVHFDRVVMPRLLYPCRVVGSCNGIVCLCDLNDDAYLWNPSIRHFKKLPASSLNITNNWLPRNYGFGYDSVSGDYKVVMMYADLPILQVYSTNAYSWKDIWYGVDTLWEKYTGTNVVVNNVLYFDIWNELVSFDMHTEVFGLVPFPSGVQRKGSDVLDFEGSVAVVFLSDSGFDLWTLDDVSGSVEEVSWTKKFSTQLNDYEEGRIWLKSYLGAGQFYGEKSIDDGDIFLYNVLYDYQKREAKYYGLGEECKVLAALKYNGTFVSLDGFEKTPD